MAAACVFAPVAAAPFATHQAQQQGHARMPGAVLHPVVYESPDGINGSAHQAGAGAGSASVHDPYPAHAHHRGRGPVPPATDAQVTNTLPGRSHAPPAAYTAHHAEHTRQQGQPWCHAPHTGPRALAVLGAHFCCDAAVELKLQEKVCLSGDSMDIRDASGQLRFLLKAQVLTLHKRRQLLDPQGRVILTLERNLVSLHGTWGMFAGAECSPASKVAEIKPALLSLKPRITVHLTRTDAAASFAISGGLLARRFKITCVSGGEERLAAEVKKESRFASAGSYLKNVVLYKQAYFLTVQPGVDAAFVVALACLLDELYHEH